MRTSAQENADFDLFGQQFWASFLFDKKQGIQSLHSLAIDQFHFQDSEGPLQFPWVTFAQNKTNLISTAIFFARMLSVGDIPFSWELHSSESCHSNQYLYLIARIAHVEYRLHTDPEIPFNKRL